MALGWFWGVVVRMEQLLLTSPSFPFFSYAPPHVLYRIQSHWDAPVWAHPWVDMPLEGMPALTYSHADRASCSILVLPLLFCFGFFFPSSFLSSIFWAFLNIFYKGPTKSSEVGSIADPAGAGNVLEMKNADIFPGILLLLQPDAKAFPYEFSTPFNLITFDRATLIEEGTTLIIVHLELGKAFDMFFMEELQE